MSAELAETRAKQSTRRERVRVSLICDMLEERWPSMDLVAEALVERLTCDHAGVVDVSQIRPQLRRRLSAPDDFAGFRYTADRLLGRMWDYPRMLAREGVRFCDVFHIVDHSYSQLVHALPAARTVVTCHDIDTFRSTVEPAVEHRSLPFRVMTRRILSGFQMAARVVCDSRATKSDIEKYALIRPDRLVVAPLGVDGSYGPSADNAADRDADVLLSSCGQGAPLLLHVGSTVARKRIDDLLEIFADVRKTIPHAQLIRVGGPFTEPQRRRADSLAVSQSIVILPVLSRRVLAAVYRRASIVLQPSSAEGFGLPVAEALACGTPVVASDLPVLREVGGTACEYSSVGDVREWSARISSLLDERQQNSEGWSNRKHAAVRQAAQFTWAEYARRMVDVYTDVLHS